jgi:aminopeptidase N
MRFYLLATAIALLGVSSAAQESLESSRRVYLEPEFEPVEHVVDMLHLRLEVRFEPERGLVHGRVTHLFRPMRERVDSLVLDGPGIRVLAAYHRGHKIRTVAAGESITLYFATPPGWDDTDSVTIEYDAHPARGIYFVGWNDPTGRGRKQIWTQGQGTNNRYWIPCFDHQNDKLTTETIITFDQGYKVLSNGALLSRQDHSDGTSTWHYRMSHPQTTYLIMIGIGDYGVETRQSTRGVPLSLWYYPDEPERIDPTYRYTGAIIDFMENQTGIPYPWESYAQIPVRDFLHGGMENTTATVFTDNYYVDARLALDKPYTAVNAHEAAHQWFGDYVTARSGRMAWLHESFATFYTKLFFRHQFGEDEYQWQRRIEQETALEASRANRLPILHSQAGGARAYQKGSAVLDMLMNTVGEAAFRRVIRHYLTAHAYGCVETNDLYQAFQDVLGMSPFWFFDEWIYRGGEPHYVVSHSPYEGPSGEHGTEVTVRQIHPRDEMVGLFRMPIVIEIHFRDGSAISRQVVVEKETQTYLFPHGKDRQVSFVLFDPGSIILKTLTFERTLQELLAQAERAPLMIDRYDALVALRARPIDKKRDLLHRLFHRERFHALRSEALAQLLDDNDPRTFSLLRDATRDPSVEVRLTLVDSLRSLPLPLREDLETLLEDSSARVAAGALRKLTAVFPEQLGEYLSKTAGNNGIGDQLRVLRLEFGSASGNGASLDSLVDLAGQSYGYATRVEAFGALQRLNILTDDAVEAFFQAMTHWNGRLRGPATTIAQAMGVQSVHRDKFLEYYRSGTWTVDQAKTLRAFLTELGAFPLEKEEVQR